LCILAICFFESDEQNLVLEGVKSKKISCHPGRDLLKSILKLRNAGVKVEWVNECVVIFCSIKYWVTT